jgi:hypothetical protein
VEFYIDGINNGSVIDLSIDAAQVEKGAFATSYIPTTTTAVTRNADNVTVPTTGWNASTGTFVAVAGPTLLTPTSPSGTLIGWSKDSNNFIFLYRYPGGPGLYSTVAGAGTALFANTTDRMSSAVTAVGTWNSGGLGYAYVNGAAGNSVSPIVTPTGMPTTAVIGGPTANPQYYNGSISRAIVYSSALSSGNVSTVTSAVQNGP